MNQPLHELGFGSRAAQSVPESFPSLMRFPVKTLVEEFEGVEPLGSRGEACGESPAPGGWLGRQLGECFRWDGGWVCLPVEMPAGVGDGMGMLVARNVAVGGKWTHSGTTGFTGGTCQ